ncbi:PRD domain-containing protein [Lacticaseibacillus pantheris]|jgi:transcriptional antiterminator|uniref:Prd domain protein n=1 Tax=Lacticaseibacillus pantheris DSM 15945 = JCM 12539 = NBRC 106106 TaxID=1423783 RepID=A0A0R1TXD7_9LACO|nr:PRD domain-containing protein [Lacticaseibacillus pantheris]KRL85889.1 prd domain protein [Lacticaseibacillus pantheris DSM 15945 = JCM 12539 = NBRC 106106]
MKLIVRQIYNNNSALVTVGEGKEAVIQGKGIGFGKRKGDVIDASNASKILYLDDSRVRGQFASLLKNVPIDIVVTVFGAVDQAKRDYHMQLLNYVYITLTDHVFQMYKRLMDGRYQPSVVPDIHDRFPAEYAVAQATLASINRALNVQFPQAEVKSLALHFINAQGEENDDTVAATPDMTTEVNNTVKSVFSRYHIQRNVANQNYFDRLMIHLQYMVERVKANDQDAQTLSSEIYREYQQKFPRSYGIAAEIADQLEKQLQVQLTENERLYFIIHIQRLIQENDAQE